MHVPTEILDEKKIRLKGLSCATCAAEIERAKSGYTSASVNFSTGVVLLRGDAEQAKRVIKQVEPEVEFISTSEKEEEDPRRPLYYIVPAIMLFIVGLIFRYW